MQSCIDENIYARINDSLYFIFVVSGIISIIFVIIRFCLNRPLVQSAKNFFVIRHIIYIVSLSGLFINELSFLKGDIFSENVAVFSLGIVIL